MDTPKNITNKCLQTKKVQNESLLKVMLTHLLIKIELMLNVRPRRFSSYFSPTFAY